MARTSLRSSTQGAAVQGPPLAPSLSVVVPVLGAAESIGATLAVLVPRCAALHAELIIVTAVQTSLPRHLPHAFPGVRFIKAPAESSSPSGLRTFGVRHASGDLIAIRPDLDLGDLGWLAPFAASVQSGREDGASASGSIASGSIASGTLIGSPLATSAHVEVEVPLDGIIH